MSDLEIRLATAADLSAIAGLHSISWRTAYRDVVPEILLSAQDSAARLAGWVRTHAEFPENLWVAGSRSSDVVGFCCAGPAVDRAKNDPYEFEVYGLHVAPSQYRHGIGAGLMAKQFERCDQLGLRGVIVWTLESLDGSRRFYERLGGTLVKRAPWQVAGYVLPEVAYGWGI